MKLLLYPISTIIVTALLVGCGDDTVGPDDQATYIGYVNFKANGKPVSCEFEVLAQYTSQRSGDYYVIDGFDPSDDAVFTSYLFGIPLFGREAPLTLPIVLEYDEDNPRAAANGMVAIALGNGIFNPEDSAHGSITIQELTDTHVAGSFWLTEWGVVRDFNTLAPVQVDAMLNITEGTFRLPHTNEPQLGVRLTLPGKGIAWR